MFCVVGMNFSLPNEIKTKEKFWKLIETETYTSRESIPTNCWNHEKYFHKKYNRKGYTNISTSKFLKKDELNTFDKMFFDKFSKKSIEKVDIQQIQLLEHTYLAFEDSGLKMNNFEGSNKVGVYVGQMNNDKLLTSMYERNIIDENTGLSNLSCMSSNRISWFYDFKGPSLNIDTACSSSLISLHYGLNDLKDGIVDLIVVGSSNIISNPLYFLTFGKMGVLGNGKSLAKDTTGYTRGEGTVVLLIKRFDDCIKERIPIYCKILGSHINHNGFLNNLISIPSKNAQIELIRKCYEKLNIKIRDTGYFEVHGVHCTGTKKGDITELRALKELLDEEDHKVYIGNTKRHFGHLESCSALSSIVKSILVLQKGKIPALLDENETPINLLNENCFIYSNNENIKWESADGMARRISINSFGIGGSNGHVVLEEFISGDTEKSLVETDTKEDIIVSDKVILIPITAKSKSSIVHLKKKWGDINFDEKDDDCFSDLLYWSVFKREFFKYRTVLLLKDKNIIGEVVCDDDDKNLNKKEDKKILFVFAGQGVQYKNMGKQLFHYEIAFKECMLICDNVIKEICQFSIVDMLFNEETEMKNSPLYSHVLITAVQLSLVYLWNYYNISPSYVLGHSSGEIAAAYACKALSLEECIKISYYRGKYVEDFINKNTDIKYGMGYVSGLKANELKEKLIEYENDICIACFNSDTSFTISGILDKIEEFFSTLLLLQKDENTKIFTKILEGITSPYHSPFLKERISEFEKDIQEQVKPKNGGNIKFFSSILGKEIEGEQLDIEYWKNSLFKQVNFVEICRKILILLEMKEEVKFDLIIDLSPHPVLYRILNENKICIDNFVFSMNKKNLEVENEFFLRNLSMLFIAYGIDINWKKLYPFELKNPYCHIESIPSYPFDKRNIRKPFSPKLNYNLYHNDVCHVLLGKKLQTKIQIWENTLSFDVDERMIDHNINNLVIYPASAYLEMGIAVVKNMFPNINEFEFSEMKFLSLLQINDVPNVKIQTILQNEQIEIFYTILKSDGVIKEWIKCFSCKFLVTKNEKNELKEEDENTTFTNCLSTSNKFEVNVRKFYKKHTYYGFKYGKYFKNIKKLYINSSSSLCLIDKKNINEEYFVDPTLLDSCFQSLFAISHLYSNCIPVSIEKMKINLLEKNTTENDENGSFIGFGEIVKTEKNKIFSDVEFGSINHKILKINNIEFEKLEERNILKDCLSSLKWEKVEIKNEKEYKNNDEEEVIFLYCDNDETNQLFLSINENIMINSTDFDFQLQQSKQFMMIFLISSEFEPNDEYYHLIEIVQKIIKLNERIPLEIKLFMVTFGANKDSSFQVGSSTLFGFGRVLMNEEHNTMLCNLIDLESCITCENDVRNFLDLIVKLDKSTPPEIAIRENCVYEPKLYPLQYDLPDKSIETILSNNQKPIVIFGGTRGIGLSLAEYFCSNGCRNLILISKSGGEGKNTKKDYSKFSIERMRELYKCKIIIEKVDVLNCEEVESFLSKKHNSDLFGLIFSVSVIDDILICNMTKERFNSVQNTKAKGIYHIFESIIKNKVKFEFSILFSSISSIVGNLGQSNYCPKQ